MMPIQILLLLALTVIALIYFRLTKYRLGPLVLLLFVFSTGVFAVNFPDTTTKIANLLGVERGTDLLLYATVIFLCGVCAAVYGKFREIDERFTLLVRELSLLKGEREVGENE